MYCGYNSVFDENGQGYGFGCDYCRPVNDVIYIVGPLGHTGPQGEAGVVAPATEVEPTVATDAITVTNAEKNNEIIAILQAAGLLET